ncbi:MAG: hypothetical protein FJ115_00045 [Deltaproteobacteria bacterium]|nr:hypothetical protein [Deltaproteobacteria bacterium]MBM4321919.1 hypothetical protein [Deltaproteobacteria bacterium]
MIRYLIGALVLAAATAFLPMQAEGGVAGKAAARAMRSPSLKAGHKVNPEILRRDLMRDKATKVRALAAERRVFRYTSQDRAKQEIRKGIMPQSHMTSRASRGRPLSPEKAQRRYGLPTPPQVRETIHLPKGQPVRMNKSLGGSPGVGEITSTKPIPPKAIEKVIPLQ